MAYNRRDLDALLRIYIDDAELYEHPATLLAKGTEALRKRFELRFREAILQATILGRMVMGSIVIDPEEVTRTFPKGHGNVQLTNLRDQERKDNSGMGYRWPKKRRGCGL